MRKLSEEKLRNRLAELEEGIKWKPVDTAPKGGGAEFVDDPAYIQPPEILMTDESGQEFVVRYDAYYDVGGSGHDQGGDGWVLALTGEQLHFYVDNPRGWMRLPSELNEDEEG